MYGMRSSAMPSEMGSNAAMRTQSTAGVGVWPQGHDQADSRGAHTRMRIVDWAREALLSAAARVGPGGPCRPRHTPYAQHACSDHDGVSGASDPSDRKGGYGPPLWTFPQRLCAERGRSVSGAVVVAGKGFARGTSWKRMPCGPRLHFVSSSVS